ncbi:MAG: PLP-dependent aminotransferase family protein [SAR202 cluster bacterium]|nr:PLP-dependent aminotransferase family protein [SAR202 cluster bacterium]
MNPNELEKFNFGPLRSKTAPEPLPLPGKGKVLPPYPFVMSYPDPASLPIMEAHAAMGEVLKEVSNTASVYPDTQGYPPLREYIVERLAEKRDMDFTPDEVLLTEGSGQAIHFVVEALVDPGDVVIVDDFVYGGTLWSLNRFSSDIRGVESDAEGMLPDALETTIDESLAAGKKPKMIYLIPTFQNPQSWTMPIERRREILDVAVRKGIPIVEDDGIAEFRFEGKPVPSIASLDDSGLVIHTGTFSKMIVPGMRIGYLVGSRQLLETVMAIKGSRGVTQFGALAVYKFATTRLDDHLVRLNLVLKSRRDAMLDALHDNLIDIATWSVPEGGLYTWLIMEDNIDLVAASGPAAKEGVTYDLGPNFATGEDQGRNKARLCFSFNTETEIKEGITRLANVVKTLI